MQWLRKHKHFLGLAFILTVPVLAVPEVTHAAGLLEMVKNIFVKASDVSVGNILVLILGVVRSVLILFFEQLVKLFEFAVLFDNFFTSGVNTAWRITRDFANLFFSLILLFIAISTALNISVLQPYTAKNLLPRFIIIALLINFSKPIVALVIDISQLFVVQFYRAAIGQSNTIGEKLGDFTKFAEITAGDEIDNFPYAGLMFLMVLFLALLIGVFAWLTLSFVVRLVVFWVLIALAPLAFVAALIPPLKQYWSEWLQELQKQAVKGPVALFFVWLAFTLMESVPEVSNPQQVADIGLTANPNVQRLTNFFEDFHIFDYVVVLTLLFIANTQAQKAADWAPGAAQSATAAVAGVGALGFGAYLGGRKRGFGDAGGLAKRPDIRGRQAAKMGGNVASNVASKTPYGRKLRKERKEKIENIQKNKKVFNEDRGLRGAANRVLGSKVAQNLAGKKGDEEAQKQFEKADNNKEIQNKLANNKADKINPDTFKQVEKASNEAYEEDWKEVNSPDQLAEGYVKAYEKSDFSTKMAVLKRASQVEGGLQAIKQKMNYGTGPTETSKFINQELEGGVDPETLKDSNPKIYGRLQNFRSTIDKNQTKVIGDYGETPGISDPKGYFTKNPSNSKLTALAKDKDGNFQETPYVKQDSSGNTQITTPFSKQKGISGLNTKNQLARIPTNGLLDDDTEYKSFLRQISEKDLYKYDDSGNFKSYNRDIIDDMTPEQQQELKRIINKRKNRKNYLLGVKEKALDNIL